MRFLKFLLRLYQTPLLWLSKQCFCLADRVEKWAAKDGTYIPKEKRKTQIQPQTMPLNNLVPAVDAESAEISRSLRHAEDMEKTKRYWRSALGWGLLAWWGLS